MNIDHLREFIYLAETLSFSATARHFFMSTSVLSKHIAAMEADLQAKLFDRDSRSVRLTDDGELFYRHVIPVVEGYDRALSELGKSRADKGLHLRVGYLRGAARPFLPRFIRYVERERPDVDVEIRCLEYGELIREHTKRNLDIIFNMDFDPEAVEACDSEVIYHDKLYVVVGKGHPLAAREGGLEVGELAGERLLLPDEDEYPGLAQRFEAIVGGGCDACDAKRYKDIDTLYFQIAQDNCVGLSSGHNHRQFEGKAAFLPLLDVDTTYSISVQWLVGCDERVAAFARDAAAFCADYMRAWSDGIS